MTFLRNSHNNSVNRTHGNGQLVAEVHYENGKEVGTWNSWNADSQKE